MEDLQKRFEKLKSYMTEDNNNVVPTDKEVWEAMRKTTKQNMLEAEADDCQGIVISYQKRIKLIDAKLVHILIDEQAEEFKAMVRYEQGMGVD